MLGMVLLSLVMMLVNMGMQVAFYSVAAYYVAKYARKGWNAGK